MEVMPGYKQTEVGVIPENWKIKSLGEVACIATGNTPPTCDETNYGDEFLFVSPVDLGRSKYISRTEKMLSRNGFAKARRFPQNSILFVCIGSTIGKCGIASKELTSNQQINAIYPSSVLVSDYLYYAISAASSRIKTLAGEQAVPIVNKRQFSETLISFPPVKVEQEAIAEALNATDSFLESLEQLIAKKRRLKQGAMQELLTGKKRLPGFANDRISYKQTAIGVIPEDWDAKTIDQVGFVTSGKRLPLGSSLTEHRTPHPYIRVTDMRPGTVSLSGIKFVPESIYPVISRYRIFQNDIFISVAGTLGIVGKIPKELDGANLTENADRITNITCSQDYLLHVMMSPLVQNTIDALRTVGAQPKLALTRIRKFVVPIPPTKAEQTAIATLLSDMDSEITALEASLTKARQLKQGMMQNLLTGKIRLV